MRPAPIPPLPLPGVSKCGTTDLYHRLVMHRGVLAARNKARGAGVWGRAAAELRRASFALPQAAAPWTPQNGLERAGTRACAPARVSFARVWPSPIQCAAAKQPPRARHPCAPGAPLLGRVPLPARRPLRRRRRRRLWRLCEALLTRIRHHPRPPRRRHRRGERCAFGILSNAPAGGCAGGWAPPAFGPCKPSAPPPSPLSQALDHPSHAPNPSCTGVLPLPQLHERTPLVHTGRAMARRPLLLPNRPSPLHRRPPTPTRAPTASTRAAPRWRAPAAVTSPCRCCCARRRPTCG